MGHLKLRLLMSKGHMVALDEVYELARVGFFTLHVVPFHVFHVDFACNDSASTSQGLREGRA